MVSIELLLIVIAILGTGIVWNAYDIAQLKKDN